MPPQRGLVPPAIITSTVAMVVCAVGWGALGALSAESHRLAPPLHRYLSLLLVTLTLGSLMINLFARLARAIRTEPAADRYAAGYVDGVEAAPDATVSRFVRR